MIRFRHLLPAAFALLGSISLHAQTVEYGNVNVVQVGSGNTAPDVTLTKGAGSSPNFSILGGNRGDFNVSFGTADDPAGGVMMTCVSQNGRNNTAGGDTTGLFYATTASSVIASGYSIPVFACASGDEVNINIACGWFSYSQWLGGLASNAAGTNGGANDTFTGSAGINLGNQFVDNGGGTSTVKLAGLGGSSQSGILLVTHGKNEDNYALSQANANGTFTVYVHDNGINGGTYEQDPVAFVYIPTSAVGTKQLVAMGRVNSNASTDIAGGNFTITKGGAGQWYLKITGQSNTTGVLFVSPEGGGTNNFDNVVSYQWDQANTRWIIESRDLVNATTQPTLQNGDTGTEDMFSFAFFQAPVAPTVAITSPAAGTVNAPATFIVAATASDSDGTVTKVEFLRNGVVVGTDTVAPYELIQSALPAGAYTYVARATDNSSAVASSAPVTVNVQAVVNPPPVVTPITPANGATITGSSTNLEIGINEPDGSATTVTFYGRYIPPATAGADFSMVAIPDTQFYSEGAPAHADTITTEQLVATFGAQTQWVVDNRQTRNIAFVSHMGDLVQSGANWGNDIEWLRASAALGRLENPVAAMLAHGVPFGAAPGNHDMDPNGEYDGPNSLIPFNRFFPVSRFAGRGYYGGHYGVENTNNYQLWSASGLDFISIHFAYDDSPNQSILDWADALLKAYPHRRAIVTSHSIIGGGNPANFSGQGQAIYDALKDNPNFFLMLCGHIHAEGRRTDVYQGKTVYSILQDYQGCINGGNGFMRIYTFSPANNRIRLESYSPTLNRAVNASDNVPSWSTAFDLPYNMQAPVMEWVPLGTVAVAAGGTSAATNWTGLEAGKNYEWYAAVSDGVNTVSTPARRFVTATGTAPIITLDTPSQGQNFLTPATVELARTEFYADGTKLGEDTDAPYTCTWSGAMPGTYAISAVAVDNSGLATLSNSAAVTVAYGDFPPTVALTAPANGTPLASPASLTLTASATDSEGPITKVEFYANDVLLGEDTTAPYTLPVTDLGTDYYLLTARATDSAGQSTVSAPVRLIVFTKVQPPSLANLSVGNFDVPTWTIAATSPSPRQFNLPGTVEGQLELRVNGVNVNFASGVTLASNWNSPATVAAGKGSKDNISEPYPNAAGNAFIRLIDNSNNNDPGSNPSTSLQTAGLGAAFLPYSDGWVGAAVDADGNVLSGNLPPGVTVTRTGFKGWCRIAGLSPAGNLIAVAKNGGSGEGDNVISVRTFEDEWAVETRDNSGTGQNAGFSFVYIPQEAMGVYSGQIRSNGTLASPNAALANLGATVTVTPDYYEITFGDGSIINPSTATLFLAADSSATPAYSKAVDNLISWFTEGNSFRIFTQDLPEITGAFEAIDVRFLAIPFSSVSGTLTRGPYLQKAAPNQMTVCWRSSKSVIGRVQYGTSPDALNLTAQDTAATANHSVTLTGLAPNTTYYYSVGTAVETLASGSSYTFTTPPLAGTPANTRVWVLGDAGTGTASQVAVRDAFNTWTGTRSPDLVLQLGNNAPGAGTDAQFQTGMFNVYPTLLRRAPFWSSLGNNETGQATAFVDTYPYFSIYDLPTAGESGGVPSGTEHYYSFDYGNVHFISLDSMTASRSATGAMATWLANDLTSTTATWIVAFFHHPPYTKGSQNSDTGIEMMEMRQNILPILEAGGVDLVLGGHSQSYERSYLLDGHYGLSTSFTGAMQRNAGDGRTAGTGAYLKPLTGPRDHQGAVYVVAGSAGQIGGGALNHPAHFLSLNGLGSLVLDVNGPRLDATFVKSDGTIPDTFTIFKQGAADSDGDGLPDEYEIAHGLDRHNPADAALDTDGDNLTNLQEFRAGTNPNDATDKPRIASLAAQPDGSLVLQIPTVEGVHYRIEANDTFPSGTWSVIAENIAGTGTPVTVPDATAAGKPSRIYRVIALP